MFLDLAGSSEEQLQSAVHLLVKYSVVNGEEKRSVLSIHRLVQEVTRLELKGQDKEEGNLKVVLKLMTEGLKKGNLDHAVSAWSYGSKYSELVKEFSELPGRIIRELEDSVRYEEAYLFGKGALQLLCSVLGSNHPDSLTVRYHMAGVLINKVNFKRHWRHFKTVLTEERKF
jgi:hypothetical protein